MPLENRKAAPAALADAYGALGRLFMAADLDDAAEPCLFNAQTLAPTDVRWPYYLGHLYRDRGELATRKNVLRAQPASCGRMMSRRWSGSATSSWRWGSPDEAEPRFAKALSLQPNSLSARFGLGRTALAKQDYRSAVTYLEEVLDAGSRGRGRALSAGDWPIEGWVTEEGRDASAATGGSQDPSGRSADGGARRAAGEPAVLRVAGHSRARPERL